MKFSEKNNFIVKHKTDQYFDQDAKLFSKKFPEHSLNLDIKRANSFTKRVLDGKILYELLDKVSPEEILSNRNKEHKSVQKTPKTGQKSPKAKQKPPKAKQKPPKAKQKPENEVQNTQEEKENADTLKKKASTTNSPE